MSYTATVYIPLIPSLPYPFATMYIPLFLFPPYFLPTVYILLLLSRPYLFWLSSFPQLVPLLFPRLSFYTIGFHQCRLHDCGWGITYWSVGNLAVATPLRKTSQQPLTTTWFPPYRCMSHMSHRSHRLRMNFGATFEFMKNLLTHRWDRALPLPLSPSSRLPWCWPNSSVSSPASVHSKGQHLNLFLYLCFSTHLWGWAECPLGAQ